MYSPLHSYNCQVFNYSSTNINYMGILNKLLHVLFIYSIFDGLINPFLHYCVTVIHSWRCIFVPEF